MKDKISNVNILNLDENSILVFHYNISGVLPASIDKACKSALESLKESVGKEIKVLVVPYKDDKRNIFEVIQKSQIDKFKEMASIEEPWELFEPKLWKDKIGDGLWHCAMKSPSAILSECTGKTMDEAIENCYNHFTESAKKYNEELIKEKESNKC